MHNDYQAREAARKVAAQALIATHPHLVPAGDRVTTAAKNIRIQLRRAFPGIAFQVTTKRYSGGESINVRWIDGPTRLQVEPITDQYSAGDFDGMTDSYNPRDDHAWPDAFGCAKYVFAERHYSDQAVLSAARRVKAKLGGISETEEQIAALWKVGNCHMVKQSGGCDVGRAMTVALSRHTYAINKA